MRAKSSKQRCPARCKLVVVNFSLFLLNVVYIQLPNESFKAKHTAAVTNFALCEN